MPRIHNPIRKSELARALATGATVVAWAKEKTARTPPASRGAGSRPALDEVEPTRRAALEHAIGRLSGNANDAAEQINRLAKEAASESVRLQASRAVLAELLTVSSHAALEH